jgi:hypothetical protein
LKIPNEPYELETEDKIDPSLVSVAGEEWRLLYDALGRVTTAVIFTDGRESGRLAFHYDVAGHIVQMEKTGEFTEKTLFLVLDSVYSLAVAFVAAGLATEATLLTRATEATLLTRATEATLLTRATEATLLTRATEATLLTRATEATLLTRATEATLLTRATEATLLTRATEATLLTRATEATLLTRATEATLLALAANFPLTSPAQAIQIWGPVGAFLQTLPTGELGVDLYRIGGTALTARNWSPDFKTLTDNTDTDKYRVLPLAKGKTSILKSGQSSGVASTNLHTVTNGKTFYLVSASLNIILNAAGPIAGSGYLEVDTAGDGVFRRILYLSCYNSAAAPAAATNPSIPMPFSAASVFRVRTDVANYYGDGCIMGWEE